MSDEWTLVSSHGVILSYISRHPASTLREIAHELGVTEMHVFGAIRDMAASGVVSIHKEGRRNSYTVNQDACFRHPSLQHVKLRDFLSLLQEPATA